MRTLSYLNQACDKKTARLVCKGFAAAGLPSLTTTAYFSTSLIEIESDHLSKVPHFSSQTQEIAMHPVVSKYITRMVCDGTQLPSSHHQLEGFQGWWATLGKNQTSEPIQQIHSRYTSKYQEEKWMIDKGEDRTIFRTALESFVNLKCIVFTDIAMVEQDRAWPRPPWPSARPEGNLWSPSSPYYTFAMCIRSLSEMAIKLPELSIEGGKNAISHGVFSRASSEDYNHLLNVFENLRKIDVNINTFRNSEFLDFAGLGRFLVHATLVQSLDLRCCGPRRFSFLLLSRVFQNVTWPHLKHFGLDGFTMHTNKDLIAFFDRHRATIDSVDMRSMYLHEKDPNSTSHSPCEAWKHLFGELRKRSITFQNLYLSRIYDCYNSERRKSDLAQRTEHGAKVLQYLRDGGPNPLASDLISEATASISAEGVDDMSRN